VSEARKSMQTRLGPLAVGLGVCAVLLAGLTLALDKSLPYRIGPDDYVHYLWGARLCGASLITSIVAMVFSIVSRQRLPFFLALVSFASLLFFIGGPHSGPNPRAWCVINLQNIEGAKQRVVQDLGLTDGAIVTTEQISKYIEGGLKSLTCAEGGHYVVGSVGADPRCSFHGSMNEIRAGWKQESTTHLGQTGAAATTNQSK